MVIKPTHFVRISYLYANTTKGKRDHTYVCLHLHIGVFSAKASCSALCPAMKGLFFFIFRP